MIQLALFYDLVSTLYYKNLSKKMAMKLGGEYDANRITIKHFESLAEEISLSKSGVRKRVIEFAESIVKELGNMNIRNKVEEDLSQLIKKRSLYMLT